MNNLCTNITSLDNEFNFWSKLANSIIIPECYRGHPEDILLVIMMGKTLALEPLQALHGIILLNGKLTLTGDTALAVVKAHKDFESIEENIENSDDIQKAIAICKIKRKNQSECVNKFSYAEAKKAGLIGRGGASAPWQTYPFRMLQMRARGFALRDSFPDALKGIICKEEVEDYPVKFVNPSAQPHYSEDDDTLALRNHVKTPEEEQTISNIKLALQNASTLEELKEVWNTNFSLIPKNKVLELSAIKDQRKQDISMSMMNVNDDIEEVTQ